MSKHFRPILLTFAAALLILQSFNRSTAQDLTVALTVHAERSSIHVDGRSPDKRAILFPLTFFSDYAGVAFPTDRITNIKQDGGSWSYDVDLTPMKHVRPSAHASWLTTDRGVLMLQDLLPHHAAGYTKLTLEFPEEQRNFSTFPVWPVSTTEKRLSDGSYLLKATDKAVFYVRFESAYPIDRLGGRRPMIGVFTTSPMAGVDLLEVGEEVYLKYRGIFGGGREPVAIAVAKFPLDVTGPRWEADTRGTSITIFTSDPTFQSQSLQQLHEQLRHEMFHLWIPEGLSLTGHYDWFYEGFALYQSLKLGVAVNRIRFDDYLDTLSRAYDIDRRVGGKTSLIDASNNRWSGDNNTVVYARGMLFAFLCDLALLNPSKEKLSSDNIVREVYSKYSGSAQRRDGNEAVIEILKHHGELVPIVDKYVNGNGPLDWTDLINAAGLRAETKSGVTALSLVAKPDSRQKRLLDKLGYNNWRKLSSK